MRRQEKREQEEKETLSCGRQCTSSRRLLLVQTALDCGIILMPIVCDSISPSAQGCNVNIYISAWTVHLQPEPGVALEQAFSQRTWEIEFTAFPDVLNNLSN